MRRKRFLALFLFFSLAVGMVSWHSNQTSIKADTISRQIVLKLAPGNLIGPILSKFNLALLDQILSQNVFLVRTPPLININLLITLLRLEPGVELVEPNFLMWSNHQPIGYPGGDPTLLGTNSTAYTTQQLNAFLRTDEVHELSQGQGVIVGLVDTGIDSSHPAFSGHSVLNGYDFVDNDQTPNDEPGGSAYGHGTFISGLIFFLSPQAQILPIRVLHPDGTGDSFHVAAGIYYAADHGANVINLSLGTDQDASILRKAVVYSQNAGCLVVAAVGNENTNATSIFPASYPNVMAIAATDFNDLKAGFSNYGPTVVLDAPGVNLVSTYPQGNYAYWSGTSFATPLASAEGALLLAQGKSRAEVVNIMNNFVVDIDQTSYQLGNGRISPLDALSNNK